MPDMRSADRKGQCVDTRLGQLSNVYTVSETQQNVNEKLQAENAELWGVFEYLLEFRAAAGHSEYNREWRIWERARANLRKNLAALLEKKKRGQNHVSDKRGQTISDDGEEEL